MAGLNPLMGGMVAGAAVGGAIGNAASTAGAALGLTRKKKAAGGGGGLLAGGLAGLPGFFGNARQQPQPEPVGTGGGADQVGKPKRKRNQTPNGTVLTGRSGMTDATGLPPGVQTLGGSKTVLGA